jgi:transposase
VELFSGACFFQVQPVARTEQIATYFLDLATYLHAQGYGKVHFFLDNNTTHLTTMTTLFQQQSGHLPLKVTFHYFPRYSPKLNIVEYLIHLIRQKWLRQPRSITLITNSDWRQ